MRNVLVFKKRYVLLAMLFFIVSFVTYRITQFSPVGQSVINKVKVNNLINLYVTEVNAGATTAFSYRLYLFDASKSDAAFNQSLNGKSHPFLITSDRHALKKVENQAIYVSVKGEVYSFYSSPGIMKNGLIYSVPVYLTVTPF
ncbi:hypothetical protein SD961_06050 [Erwinia sp. MMLR14_017]|uniref:hypothetical protein n=1 Tax=Erwinia sp. MMLR14_017 TaxID=3093842 RepID=UPI00299065E8|nr:hypothetical protein [Erwinia sp. MMLR14_017]MDW8845461.1 hypothetical protein [Erwinia sp. MMLR14_017]